MATPMKLRARIGRIEDHAPSVRSLFLVPERPVPRFKPGQFLHLALDPYDPSSHWPESRVYSIASSPEERTVVRLTISKKGPFSQRIFNLKTDDEVWIKLPYGEFVVETTPDREVALVAGGTGITPFTSLLLSKSTGASGLRVFYGSAAPDLLIYADVVREASKYFQDYAYRIFCEKSAPASADVVSGRLGLDGIWPAMKAPLTAIWYLSGPAAMIENLRTALLSRGLPAGQIRVDEWI